MQKSIFFSGFLTCLMVLGSACAPVHDVDGSNSNSDDDESYEATTMSRDQVVTGAVTMYGFDDNDDGRGNWGSASIALPHIHDKATEDLGTYDHPATFATAKHIAPKGTRIYIPKFKKYYVMEDICGACSKKRTRGRTKVDLFIGENHRLQGRPLKSCQNQLTHRGFNETIIFNPGPDYPVVTTPIFRDGVCNTDAFN